MCIIWLTHYNSNSPPDTVKLSPCFTIRHNDKQLLWIEYINAKESFLLLCYLWDLQ
jgi:hypothetical protein